MHQNMPYIAHLFLLSNTITSTTLVKMAVLFFSSSSLSLARAHSLTLYVVRLQAVFKTFFSLTREREKQSAVGPAKRPKFKTFQHQSIHFKIQTICIRSTGRKHQQRTVYLYTLVGID